MHYFWYKSSVFSHIYGRYDVFMMNITHIMIVFSTFMMKKARGYDFKVKICVKRK